MSVLIPILSKQENDTTFLSKAVNENEQEVYLMVIVENQSLDLNFGFTATEISRGNELIDEIKNTLSQNGKRVFDILEWGETVPKIVNFAKLKKIKKICLKKQESNEFKKLVKKLKDHNLNVEVI